MRIFFTLSKLKIISVLNILHFSQQMYVLPVDLKSFSSLFCYDYVEPMYYMCGDFATSK